ncbi:hypothetical protein DUNSADRAFT_2746 [Dunaliella salina]|uniref:Uncharacterized protein n=1 Tax=Dunaliella salina TaxID=3046 RepID=A0ABQ7FW10_DUNSA|nr:hypothetical protein DUNSADRAFT_2746 [Dunaliella salina]|eukprot:KAF5826561.1 hypothetical protein DUNSADRAFT_2746 [Dunaliella salina]
MVGGSLFWYGARGYAPHWQQACAAVYSDTCWCACPCGAAYSGLLTLLHTVACTAGVLAWLPRCTELCAALLLHAQCMRRNKCADVFWRGLCAWTLHYQVLALEYKRGSLFVLDQTLTSPWKRMEVGLVAALIDAQVFRFSQCFIACTLVPLYKITALEPPTLECLKKFVITLVDI